MLENDKGRPTLEVSADFEEAFGFPLSRAQISLFRSTHGTQSRRSHGGGRPRRPIGFEREVKGYIIVKVAEEATMPQSKDNWKLKHVHIWEQAYGPLPKGWAVLFCDHNRRNFDLDNLLAVPRRYMSQLNSIGGWHDQESVKAALAIMDLTTAALDAQNRPRACKICGQEFTPPENLRYTKNNTCPECVAQGRKSYKMHGTAGEAECVVCGAPFVKNKKNQRRCESCIAEKPKTAPSIHRDQCERNLS